MTSEAEQLAALYDRAKWARGKADAIVSRFHRLFYDTERHAATRWMGHECWKFPTDMIAYAELIHDLAPRAILESGTYRGGSALFFAHALDAVGEGRVLTIDIHDDDDLGPDARGQLRPHHPRITYAKGSSVDPEVVAAAREWRLDVGGPCLLILDSDHTAPHVRAELDAYADLADVIVVEDTNLGGVVLKKWGPGPREAVNEWLADNAGWKLDPWIERMLLTCAPGGLLRRA